MKKFATAVGLIAGTALIAAPASAHGFTITQGLDEGIMGSGHQRIWAVDNECDSHSARLYYKTHLMVQAGAAAKYFTDRNGCDPGSTVLETESGGYEFAEIKLCEYNDTTNNLSCTSWHNS